MVSAAAPSGGIVQPTIHHTWMALLIAMSVSAIVLALLVWSRAAEMILDRPTHRSLHARPTPRVGGIGIIAGIGAAWAYAGVVPQIELMIALALVVGISLIDDVRAINVPTRFVVHFTSAIVTVVLALRIADPVPAVAAVLAIAWMTNLYNFMDGADGLAGGMALTGFGTYGLAALIAGDYALAAVNFSIAGAALGFLFFNFPPARIFLGDTGSIPLGFLAAVVNIAGAQRGVWPLWLGIMIFSPFIFDASITLLRRAISRANILTAHRDHYYQRLVQMGWGHRQTALFSYALMLAAGLSALYGMTLPAHAQAALCAAWIVFYSAMFALAGRSWRRHVERADPMRRTL